MFSVKDMHNGIHITFANGVTVSVQWHGGNYCANRNEEFDTDKPCENAEVAVWDKDDAWLTRRVWTGLGKGPLGDDVAGWVSPDEVAEVLAYAAKMEV